MNWDKPKKALGVQSQNYRRKKRNRRRAKTSYFTKEKDLLLLKANPWVGVLDTQVNRKYSKMDFLNLIGIMNLLSN